MTGAFVLGLVQIVSSCLLLGVFGGYLKLWPLFILNIAISFLVTGLSIKKLKQNHNSFLEIIRDICSEIIMWLRTLRAETAVNFYLAFAVMLVIITGCWLIFLGWLMPSSSWDSLWYHLPMVGYIMQNGAIAPVEINSFIEQFINYFPQNMELLFLWNIVFMKDDVIVDLTQMAFIPFAMISVYGISTKMGVSRHNALYASLLFFFTPIMLMQSVTNYIDVMISALFLIAVNFLFPSSHFNTMRPESRRLCLVLGGLTTGLLFGSKGSGVIFAAVLYLPAMYLAARSSLIRGQVKWFSTAGYCTVYFLLPVLLTGGYWYLRNWLAYGNPLYPMHISFAGFTIFKGIYSGMIESAPAAVASLPLLLRPLYVWLEGLARYSYDSRVGGLGPIWFIQLLPAMFIMAALALYKKRFEYLALIVLAALVFIFHPRHWTPRYVIFLTGFGAVAFAMTLDYLKKRAWFFQVISLSLILYTSVTVISAFADPLKIREFMHLPYAERSIARLRPIHIDSQARQEYGVWEWIRRNVREGDVLAYTFEPLFHAPMWNHEYSSRIVYIKADGKSALYEELNANNVAFILVRANSSMDRLLINDEGICSDCTVLYEDENYRIFSLKNHG
ncbi:MAG: hypothetical protein ISR96_07190 [Nitrospira sp.]|nr:hypothetical protein [bacterium]MBL7049280.1 hypothetical protein [Nitrospira sp.]